MKNGKNVWVNEMSEYPELLQEFINKKYIEVCPKCGALSAYDWHDVNFYNDERIDDEDTTFNDSEYPNIYPISSAGMDTWHCGKCGTYWVDKDSSLLAECYTHEENDQYDCNFEE